MPSTTNPPVDPTTRQHARENRHHQSPAEARVWKVLRNHNLDGLKFRRQHPLGPYIVDFYCHEAKLVVELDGRSHDAQMDYDAARTAWLEGQGCRVIRFSNMQVMQDIVSVVEGVRLACEKRPSP
jgi:very-short-patch-repair endonuclease